MSRRRIRRRRLLAAMLLVAVVLSLTAGFSARNIVAASRAAIGAFGVTANNLKPPQCASLNLTVVRGVSSPGGAGGASLFVGTAGADRLVGGGQSDCIVGGAGNDTINAGGGTDVCIGGAGNDTFQGCETAIQ